jgi:hypothetical protein
MRKAVPAGASRDAVSALVSVSRLTLEAQLPGDAGDRAMNELQAIADATTVAGIVRKAGDPIALVGELLAGGPIGLGDELANAIPVQDGPTKGGASTAAVENAARNPLALPPRPFGSSQ